MAADVRVAVEGGANEGRPGLDLRMGWCACRKEKGGQVGANKLEEHREGEAAGGSEGRREEEEERDKWEHEGCVVRAGIISV